MYSKTEIRLWASRNETIVTFEHYDDRISEVYQSKRIYRTVTQASAWRITKFLSDMKPFRVNFHTWGLVIKYRVCK